MAMKILKARRGSGRIQIDVHLDTSKFTLDKDGQPTTTPDPDYVGRYVFSDDAIRDNGTTLAALVATLKEQVRGLAREQLVRVNAAKNPVGDVAIPALEGQAI